MTDAINRALTAVAERIQIRGIEMGLIRHSDPNGKLYIKAVDSVHVHVCRPREVRSAAEFVEVMLSSLTTPFTADEQAQAVAWYNALGRTEWTVAAERARCLAAVDAERQERTLPCINLPRGGDGCDCVPCVTNRISFAALDAVARRITNDPGASR